MRYLILATMIVSCGTSKTTNTKPEYTGQLRTATSEFISYDLMPGHCELIVEINTLICSPDFKGVQR